MVLAVVLLAMAGWLQAAEDRGGLVVQVLSAETETPVSGAVVRVFNRSRTKVIMQGVTGSDGKIRLSGLSIGELFVEAHKDGVGLDRSLISIYAGSDSLFEAFLLPEDEGETSIEIHCPDHGLHHISEN